MSNKPKRIKPSTLELYPVMTALKIQHRYHYSQYWYKRQAIKILNKEATLADYLPRD